MNYSSGFQNYYNKLIIRHVILSSNNNNNIIIVILPRIYPGQWSSTVIADQNHPASCNIPKGQAHPGQFHQGLWRQGPGVSILRVLQVIPKHSQSREPWVSGDFLPKFSRDIHWLHVLSWNSNNFHSSDIYLGSKIRSHLSYILFNRLTSSYRWVQLLSPEM